MKPEIHGIINQRISHIKEVVAQLAEVEKVIADMSQIEGIVLNLRDSQKNSFHLSKTLRLRLANGTPAVLDLLKAEKAHLRRVIHLTHAKALEDARALFEANMTPLREIAEELSSILSQPEEEQAPVRRIRSKEST